MARDPGTCAVCLKRQTSTQCPGCCQLNCPRIYVCYYPRQPDLNHGWRCTHCTEEALYGP